MKLMSHHDMFADRSPKGEEREEAAAGIIDEKRDDPGRLRFEPDGVDPERDGESR